MGGARLLLGDQPLTEGRRRVADRSIGSRRIVHSLGLFGILLNKLKVTIFAVNKAIRSTTIVAANTSR